MKTSHRVLKFIVGLLAVRSGWVDSDEYLFMTTFSADGIGFCESITRKIKMRQSVFGKVSNLT